MRMLLAALSVLAVHTLSPRAIAQDDCAKQCPLCLSEEDKKVVKDSLTELKEIKGSKATVEVKDEIVIVRDWEDRVYVNGGEGRPIRATLKLGSTVERDLEIQLPVRVHYREAPPDPMFRLRLRAQAGILAPTIWEDPKLGWDGGVGWDFFHLGPVNLSVYTGIRSVGGGLGLDLTRNFGPYAGYSLVYDGLRSTGLAGIYFSFN